MSKRKADKQDASGDVNMDSDSDDSTPELVNVDFEFFDPQPETDFHGFRTLLRQLLEPDSNLHDLSVLADLILSQPTIGSTVKVDGKESDPYALLTVLNLKVHGENEGIKKLLSYLFAQLAKDPSSASFLSTLKQTLESKTVGLIISERLLNIPIEIAPPMYKMLVEELQWAVDDGEPYIFDAYLVLSKTYKETTSALDAEEEADAPPEPAKKKWKFGAKGKAKKKVNEPSATTFYFHLEDELLVKEGVSGSFPYKADTEGTADAKRVFGEFGIVPRGFAVLVDKDGMTRAIENMQKVFPQEG